MVIYFYITEREYNNATSSYIKAAEETFTLADYEVRYTSTYKNIGSGDTVFVVNYLTYLHILLFVRSKKVIIWIQGILPEELVLGRSWNLKAQIKRLFYNLVERWILSDARLLLVVSQSMINHFERKWNLKCNNYFVMPCFNKDICKESFFFPDKYEHPAFVYAGTTSKWQCVEEILALYKEIEDELPNSSLLLLTQQKREMSLLVKKSGVKNATIDYVPLSEIDDVLKRCKYAFLIRKDIRVNQVATPTKMNTYIANGLIPIYSDVIGDFKKAFKHLQPQISIKTSDSINDIVLEIKTIEQEGVSAIDIYDNYQEIFDSYYNKKKYQLGLAKLIKKNF